MAVHRSGLHLTHYTVGMYDEEHVDQFQGRPDGQNTMDRTVSCSLLLERADRGRADDVSGSAPAYCLC